MREGIGGQDSAAGLGEQGGAAKTGLDSKLFYCR